MINLRHLSLQRGNKLLLNQINITIHPGQKIGFIGANGSGKSSLFALLLEELQPDEGEIQLPPKWMIARVSQEVKASDIPAIEYVLDGDRELRYLETQLRIAQQRQDGLREAELHTQFEVIGGYTARVRAAQLLYGLGFKASEEAQPVYQFSGGWRMRLNLAQALMCRSDLLLLDEPTNHLDLDAIFWFEQWLKRYSGTLLLITHDREFLDNVVEAIAHLSQQQITLYFGNYTAFEQQRAAQLAIQQASYQKQQQQIAHIRVFVDRFRYKATKAKQAQSRLKALARMELIASAHVDSTFRFEFYPPAITPPLLIDLENVSIGYDPKIILEKVKLRLMPGTRLGLLGPNGAGKSTLMKLFAGVLSPLQGQSTFDKNLRIGYFAQHQLEQLHLDESPLQHLQRLDSQATEQSLRDFLGGFGFQGDMALSLVAPFSGGEKARLALALLVWQRPNLLLLDEPTNHLDLDMRYAITLALQNYQGALVIVSHDRHLLQVTTDQLMLVAKGRAQWFNGDLNDYRQWLLEQRGDDLRDEMKVGERATTKQLKLVQREQKRSLQNRLKQVERDLEKLITEKTQVESLLANPDVYKDLAQVKKHAEQQTMLTTQLKQMEEIWLELTESLETLSD
ncbi:MAG: ABC transporter ATP-binding protein [Beggiatoa sp. IS2]|nr:MAG: ABC transporter ATP-binding protein [Beggiatoa sp. IS2]